MPWNFHTLMQAKLCASLLIVLFCFVLLCPSSVLCQHLGCKRAQCNWNLYNPHVNVNNPSLQKQKDKQFLTETETKKYRSCTSLDCKTENRTRLRNGRRKKPQKKPWKMGPIISGRKESYKCCIASKIEASPERSFALGRGKRTWTRLFTAVLHSQISCSLSRFLIPVW